MRTLILFCLALISVNASAFPNNMDGRFAKDSTVCGGYEIFHINGILTQPEEAQQTSDADDFLRELIQRTLDQLRACL